MIKKMIAICLTVLSVATIGLAYADDETPRNFHATISVKAWNQTWSGWQSLGNFGTTASPEYGTLMNTSDASTAPIVGATLRFKDFFISGNGSPSTTYNFSATKASYSRTENDINAGMYVNQGLGISLGRKSVELDYVTNKIDYKFYTLGINASARIGNGGMFMYGNGAISLSGSTDYTTSTSWKVGTPAYRSMEAGLGYAFVNNHLILTLGYKYQDIQLPLTENSSGKTLNTRDNTTGFILGTAYTF